MRRNYTDLALGLGVLLLALLAIFAWIPNDSATAAIMKVRGRVSIGDAMAPIAAFVLVAVAGLLIAWKARKKEVTYYISRRNCAFIALLTSMFLVSILLMRWTGPVLVSLFGPEDSTYRDLRDTMPWKLSGFVVGGTFLVSGLMSLMQRKPSWTSIFVGVLTVTFLIAVFDVPFPDLLLPPNGDL
tara:strand:+ start:4475 stop:5029 length:555 start_codon:yes stop_codon:yes gene_type:complete